MNSLPRIAIIGAGIMGSGIAHAFASHGCNVTLCDVTQDRLDAAQEALNKSTSSMKDAGLLTEPELARLLRLINTTTELAKAREPADIVVEAVRDSPKVKASVLLKIADMAPAHEAV